MKPSEKFQKLVKYATDFILVIGFDTFATKFAVNGRMIAAMFYIIGWQVMVYNSVSKNWGNLNRVIQAVMTEAALFIQGARIVCYAVDRELQSSLPVICIKMLEYYENNHVYSEILQKNLLTSQEFIKVYARVLLSGLFFPSVIMLGQYFLLGKMELQSLIYMPYTDPTELSGYLINLIYIGALFILAYLGFMTYDLLIILYALHAKGIVEILKEKLKELEEELNRVIKLTDLDDEQSTSKLREQMMENLKVEHENEIHKKHVELIKDYEQYLDYLNAFIQMQSPISFVSFSAIGAAVCMGLFIMTRVSIIIGICASGVYFIQLALPCVVGAMIMIQNESLSTTLSDFAWYKLPRKNQKIHLQFIQICQNTPNLTTPIFGVLNPELLTNVMTASYSYLAFLNKMT